MTFKAKYLAGGIVASMVVVGALLLVRQGGESPPAATVAHDPDKPFAIDAAQMQRAGVRFAPAETAPEVPLASLPATIVPPPNARVAVAAIFPGIVVRTLVVEGDRVAKGQALAIVSSREVLAMGAELARAQARLGVARSNASRVSQLGREGIVSGARVEEADAALREASVDASEKSRILHLAGASGASGTYALSAPIAGRVSKSSVETGRPVDDSSAAFVIDAAGRYQIEAQLPARFASLAKPGMRIRLDDGVEGEVTAVGATIDPLTRSVALKASIPDGSGSIAGRATTVTLYRPAPDGAVMVPSAAVTTVRGKTVVFVRSGGRIVLRNVSTDGSGNDRVVLTRGLTAGEMVVVSGTSELKALALSN